MAVNVSTLVVMATNRGPDIVRDQLDAIRWSFARPFHAVVVDDAGDVGPQGDDVTVIRSRVAPAKAMSGFKSNEGIAHALARGIRFDAALVIDDDALPIGRGLDTWALDRIGRDAVDLLGVADRVDYALYWPLWAARFAAWVPESIGFTPGPGIFYAANWMSRVLVDDLAARGLLLPPGYQAWDLWPDVYISWMAQALGHYTVPAGTMDVPEPPMYLNHPDSMQGAPQPWHLHAGFLIYHSIRAVPGVSERRVREHYARVRMSADSVDT
jgi:hypothetical protein